MYNSHTHVIYVIGILGVDTDEPPSRLIGLRSTTAVYLEFDIGAGTPGKRRRDLAQMMGRSEYSPGGFDRQLK